MKQKTAIRQMIEWIENTPVEKILSKKDIKDKAQELEPVNEQQIKDAWGIGWNDRGNDDGDYSNHTDGDQYFNDTFEKL